MLAGCSNKIQGSGNVVHQVRDLEQFTDVVLSEEGDLFIEPGEQTQLVIEAEDNLQAYLVADIHKGVLDIKKVPDNVQLNATQPIRYHLTLTTLESLTLKNSGDAEVAEVETNHFQTRISGSGSLHIRTLDTTQLDVVLTSSGNLSIDNGTVETQNITLSSTGEYDGANLVSNYANVRLSSSGNAAIYALEKLEAEISSSGNLYYTGDPEIQITDLSSSGKVIKQP